MSSTQPGPSAIEALLSAARLRPYLDACGGDASAAIGLYEWNIGVSAAFWEIIVIAEVAMRNAMHDRLSHAYGPTWYDNQAILDDRSLRAIREAKRRAARGLEAGAAPTPGKVISEMSFGVWVALLDRGGTRLPLGSDCATTTRCGSQPCSTRSRRGRDTNERRTVGCASCRASAIGSATTRRSSRSRSRTPTSPCRSVMTTASP